MSNILNLMHDIEKSPTAYHVVETVKNKLLSADFVELKESESWHLEKGGKYFTVRDGSAVIAFVAGEGDGFNIVAAHTDSPCLKIKQNPEITTAGVTKLNVDKYGGGLWYSWFDRPLTIAGRYIENNNGVLESKLYESDKKVVIPSLAIHFNREANSAFAVNPQTDLMPIVGLGEGVKVVKEEWFDSDVMLVSGEKPYFAGLNDEFVVSPRLDDLACAFAAVEGLVSSKKTGLSICYLADNEEVGSSTKQGAGSTFLSDVLHRTAKSLNLDVDALLASSFMVSADNAHAIHPNHPEKSDPTNKVVLGGGVVVKHHANQNYTTDAFSSAVLKQIAASAGLKIQDFFMRADMPCGSTLGAISSRQISVRSVDIGIAQLAMHSSVETIAASDYEDAVKLMTAFYDAKISMPDSNTVIVK